jgi:hypothetical protein
LVQSYFVSIVWLLALWLLALLWVSEVYDV